MSHPEQRARDLLEQMGYEDAQGRSAGEVVALANLFSELDEAQHHWTRASEFMRKCITLLGYEQPDTDDPEKTIINPDELLELLEEQVGRNETQNKMRDILHRTADALHGGPLEDGWHSWHDLPERATTMRTALISIIKGIRRQTIDFDMGDVEVIACNAIGISHTDPLPGEPPT